LKHFSKSLYLQNLKLCILLLTPLACKVIQAKNILDFIFFSQYIIDFNHPDDTSGDWDVNVVIVDRLIEDVFTGTFKVVENLRAACSCCGFGGAIDTRRVECCCFGGCGDGGRLNTSLRASSIIIVPRRGGGGGGGGGGSGGGVSERRRGAETDRRCCCCELPIAAAVDCRRLTGGLSDRRRLSVRLLSSSLTVESALKPASPTLFL
jgi:hypothetical protein